MISKLWKWFAGSSVGLAVIGLAVWLVSLGRDKQRIEQHKQHKEQVEHERQQLKEVRNGIEKTLADIDRIDDDVVREQLYRDWIRAGLRRSRERRLESGNQL